MRPIYRRLIIFVVAIIVVAGGYLTYRFYAASKYSVSQDFSEARSKSAAISEKIVADSNDIVNFVARLSSSTSTPIEVSSTISEVSSKVSEVRVQAVELSSAMEAMARAVENVKSTEAQQAVLQSISHRLAMVSNLITYTDQVSRLALAMRLRLENGIQNSSDIAKLIKDINAEVAAVNESGRLADESMAKFDSLLR